MKNSWIPTPLPFQRKPPDSAAEPVAPPRWSGSIASVLQLLRFAGLLLLLRLRRIPVRDKAVRVRRYVERRGGLWVKIAQTLASRHDALPGIYCEELGKLFDGASAFPREQAMDIIAASMGRPVDAVFDAFPDQPLAAASIAQTYKARLRWNDELVAVKVRRPYIEAIFRRDLKMVGWLASLLNRLPNLRHLHLPDMYGELETMLSEELDFRVEATLIRDMRHNLKDRGVAVPKVFSRYCTKDVLVMSFIEGVLMSDYLRVLAEDPMKASQWARENKINTKKVARRIYVSAQRQIFEDNLFHGDLHPGNIMLLRKSRFALLDFGAVGALDLNTRKQVMLYHEMVAKGDLSKAMMVLTHMSSPTPPIDMAALLRKLARVTQKSLRFMTVKGVSYEERIYSDATNQQLRLLGEAKIPVSWDFLRAQRTFTVLEMSLRQLDPKMEPMKLSRSYFRARERRLEQAEGGRTASLFNRVEAIAQDASVVLSDLARAKTLAGRLLGRDLNECKSAAIRLLVVAVVLIGAIAGISQGLVRLL